MENPCLPGTKVYIIGPGHMTKVVSMPIYGKNALKIFFSTTISQMTLKLGTQERGLEPYNIYLNDFPGLTLTYFTTGSIFFI